MKANKLMRTLAASAMSVALLAGVTVMPAMADGVTSGTPVSSIPFTVTITTDGNSYEPDTNLTFSVTKGNAGTVAMPTSDGEPQNVTVLEGIDGGVSIAAIDTDPATTGDPSNSYENAGSVTINAQSFQSAAPGIYHYVISQTAGNVEGMKYDASKYDLYLYVQNGATGVDDHYVAYAVVVKQEDGQAGTAKTDLAFENKYGTEDGNLVYDLTVKKVVEGDMGDKVNDTFDFTVTITGTGTNEVYRIVYTNKDGEQKTVATSGQAVTLSGIKHEGVITVYGLSASDSFTVTEADNGKGYTIFADKSYENGGSSANDEADPDINQGSTIETTTMGERDHAVAFYNVKNASTPTGVIMNVAPYALMVVIALAGVAVFMRKRVED